MTQPPQTNEDVKGIVQDYWNGRAESYDTDGISGITVGEQCESWLSVLRTYIGDDSQQALDVGCGTGDISLLLAKLGHDVTGIDLSPDMLERARTKAQQASVSIDFRTGDAEELQIADNAYDLLTARHLVWTLPNPSNAIREWCRVVRPGGRIILVEGYWDFNEAWDGYREISDELPLYDGRPPEALTEFLSQEGIDHVQQESLMDPIFWGRDPEQEMYVLTFEVPE